MFSSRLRLNIRFTIRYNWVLNLSRWGTGFWLGRCWETVDQAWKGADRSTGTRFFFFVLAVTGPAPRTRPRSARPDRGHCVLARLGHRLPLRQQQGEPLILVADFITKSFPTKKCDGLPTGTDAVWGDGVGGRGRRLRPTAPSAGDRRRRRRCGAARTAATLQRRRRGGRGGR